MMREEIHPWNWYHPKGAKTIIIGTFPPTVNNWSYDFFYPNKNNYFWKILAGIAGKEIKHNTGKEAVEERKQLLNELKVGVSDMGKIIRRTADNSLDGSLEPVEYMDIGRILKENPSITKIIFTSSSGKSSAIRWFKEYLKTKGISFSIQKGPRPVKSTVVIDQKEIEVVLLYSTSPRAGAAIPFEQLVELFKNEII